MSTSYSPKAVTDSLLWYIDAGNPKSYPGSGTSVYDLAGAGVNGNMTFEAIGTTTPGAFDFSGGDTHRITFGNVRTLDPGTTDYTWECWFSASSIASDYREIWYANATGGAKGFGVMLNNNGYQIRQEVYGSLGSRQYNSKTITSYLNNWVHATYTIDQSTFQVHLYINGQYIETYSESDWGSIDSVSTLVIGNHGTGTTWDYDGKVGLMKIYNKMLSRDEVLQNYNSTKGRFIF